MTRRPALRPRAAQLDEDRCLLAVSVAGLVLVLVIGLVAIACRVLL